MSYMFQNCYCLTTVPFLDTSKVTNMSSMFSGCTSLLSIPLFNTINVTNMSYMFRACASLATIPLLNTQNVTNMSYMFQNCRNLLEVPLLDTSKNENFSGCFYFCSSLTTVPQFNTIAATNFTSMFYNCTRLVTVPQFNYISALNGNLRSIFETCPALTSVIDLRSCLASITSSFTGYDNLYSITGFFAPTNINMSVSIKNSGLDATALNAMFTALPTVSGKTLTITGSVGAATCDITIATAKGWTVVR